MRFAAYRTGFGGAVQRADYQRHGRREQGLLLRRQGCEERADGLRAFLRDAFGDPVQDGLQPAGQCLGLVGRDRAKIGGQAVHRERGERVTADDLPGDVRGHAQLGGDTLRPPDHVVEDAADLAHVECERALT